MKQFSSSQDYLQYLVDSTEVPEGFVFSTVPLTFIPRERPKAEPFRMNLSLILAEEDCQDFAGMFTRNAVPGAPVLVAKKRMKEPALRGILVNNKIANVCAPGGIDDTEALLADAGRRLGLHPEKLLSASTGIIGWKLPLEEMKTSLGSLCDSVGSAGPLDIARAIMTTDSYPKMVSRRAGDAVVLGIAKGAGMIEPNMATMLAFVLTDARISRRELQSSLSAAVETTFNCISVDGDQSTSDMVLVLSSGKKETDEQSFHRVLAQVCRELAVHIVRNGEGSSHVIEVRVRGRESAAVLRNVGKGIINSPLVKSAIYGNDPNVGRIISAVGDYCGNNALPVATGRLRISLGDVVVFQNGAFCIDESTEAQLSSYLETTAANPRLRGFPQNDAVINLTVDFLPDEEAESATVIGSDLSHEYIQINADYRT
jgi:glutamate N-acetyltransferase/amino-acid N-acetyltransferase